ADLVAALTTHPALAELKVAAADEAELQLSRGASTIIVLWPARFCERPVLEAYAERVAAGNHGLVLAGLGDHLARAAAALPGEGRFGWLTLPTSAEQAAHTIAGTLEMVELRRAAAERAKAAHRYQDERTQLLDAARALASQRDVRKLLATILESA